MILGRYSGRRGRKWRLYDGCAGRSAPVTGSQRKTGHNGMEFPVVSLMGSLVKYFAVSEVLT